VPWNVTLVRSAQAKKALVPMLVILLGMVILVSLVELKARAPMLVTLFGMVKAPVLPAGYTTKVVLVLLYNTPSCELYTVFAASTFIAVRLVQELKAQSPMLVTLLGMVILVRAV